MNEVWLKGGIIKSYHFTNEFIKENNREVKELENVWNEIYEKDCCVYGAAETNKSNDKLKEKLCIILDELFNKDVQIFNGWDNKKYKSKKEYRKYIKNYGKER